MAEYTARLLSALVSMSKARSYVLGEVRARERKRERDSPLDKSRRYDTAFQARRDIMYLYIRVCLLSPPKYISDKLQFFSCYLWQSVVLMNNGVHHAVLDGPRKTEFLPLVY